MADSAPNTADCSEKVVGTKSDAIFDAEWQKQASIEKFVEVQDQSFKIDFQEYHSEQNEKDPKVGAFS